MMELKMIKDYLKYKLRNGKQFQRFLKGVLKRESYTFDQLNKYRVEQLKKTIALAYNHVPYYQSVFKKIGLMPEDIGSIDDLTRIPLIDKEIVRKSFKDFKNKSYLGVPSKGHTSGSSGNPGVYLRDLSSINAEKAALWRQYLWAGKKLDSKRVTLRGEIVCPIDAKSGPFWKYDQFTNELLMSAYHLSDANMNLYVQEINKFKPFDLYAYPSTAYLLANYCKRRGLGVKFSCVFTSAEVLHEYQRKEIESVFDCPLYDQYGSAERVVNILQCEHGRYHEMPDYSIVEYLPIENGRYEVVGTTLFNAVMPLIRYKTGDIVEYLPIENGRYEVVGTTLFNAVMPLIRYKTGDIVELRDFNDCPCGRRFRNIKQIIGRSDDVIILKDGRKLGRLDHIFKTVEFLKEAQIIQHDFTDIEVKYVPSKNISPADKDLLMNRLHKYIGSDVRYQLNEVMHIERGSNAKFKLVKNMMDKELLV